jgi:hypothetical protein
MKNALRLLLNTLDQIRLEHPEITDTMVREEMGYAVYQGFVIQEQDFQLPREFGIFSAIGNEQVYSALSQFLSHPEVIAVGSQMRTPEERLTAFQDDQVHSVNGRTYEDFFGHADIAPE